jgi:hypothetical protein
MKRIYYIASIVAVAAGSLLAGCDNAEYTPIDNSVYMADAAESLSREKNVQIPANGADVAVSVRLAKQVDYDVPVEVKIDTDFLGEYNAQHGTSYEMLPSQYMSVPDDATVIIKAREISGAFYVHVEGFNVENVQYVIPVTIKSLSGNLHESATQSQYIFVLDKVYPSCDGSVTPKFKLSSGTTALHARPLTGWNFSTPEYTIEFWARLEKYSTQNFAMLSVYGNDGVTTDDYELYFRFGDANSGTDAVNGIKNYVNWKDRGLNLTGGYNLIANKWTHWACVYTGDKTILYRDGEVYLTGPSKFPGTPWVISEFNMIASHQATANTANVAHVRLWKKALTSDQLKANMYNEVNPTQSDLEAYWKMNEGAAFAGLLLDATGHGHDIEVTTSVLTGFGWTDPQTFQ